jgi:hypothetical protein
MKKIIMGLLTLILVLGLFVFAPKTKIIKAVDDSLIPYHDVKIKSFVVTRTVSLKDQYGKMLPDQKIMVVMDGDCYYSQDKKYSKIVIDNAYYIKPPLSSVERFEYGTKEYNPSTYSSEAYAKIQYWFLSHSNYPISPWNGYDEMWVMCTPWGSIDSNGELEII